MFDNCTLFMSSGPHLEVTIKLEEATEVFAHINNQVVEGDAMPVTIAKVKTAIDDGVLRPLFAGFTNPELAAGLLDVYGLYVSEDPDILDTPAKVAARIESLRAAPESVRTIPGYVKQANSDIAIELSLIIIDNLAGRKGVLDGIEDDICEEIRGDISNIILDKLDNQ